MKTKAKFQALDECYTDWYKCDNCKDDMITRSSNFCPNCGGEIEWLEEKQKI